MGGPMSPVGGRWATDLAYYATQSVVTAPGHFAPLFEGLPRNVPALAALLWGLMLHPVAARRAGLSLAPEREAELQLRTVPHMLARLLALDPRPLDQARPPGRKLVGNCRDSAVLLCAILRWQGIPSRARAGFASYFQPGFYGDHWLCEYWREDEGRWALADADLPPDWAGCFDPLDVPAGAFLTAGEAWQICRAGAADPATFGMPEFPANCGLGWIASQVVRDLACLNRVELLCWDRWALAATAWHGRSAADEALLDRVAAVTSAGEFGALRDLYESDDRLRVPNGFAGLDLAAV